MWEKDKLSGMVKDELTDGRAKEESAKEARSRLENITFDYYMYTRSGLKSIDTGSLCIASIFKYYL